MYSYRYLRPVSRSGRAILIQRQAYLRNITFTHFRCEENKSSASKRPTANALNTKLNELNGSLNNLWNKFLEGRGVFQHHAKNIRKSIQEANKKIAEQEKESKDAKINYKKDELTNEEIKDLPSERELHRKKWSRKLEFYLDSLQETLFTATKALNDVTGYSSIQKLKNSINLINEKLDATRKARTDLKLQYTKAIESRTLSQKQLNELLQRKSSWSPSDLENFTKLYKDDAINQQTEKELKEKVRDIEKKEEQLTDDLYRAILTRYHEEQIWSDKIRRTSTWGTFILMGFNLVLFIIFQLLLEPWKRRRLTGSFEGKVRHALELHSQEQETKIRDFLEEIKTKESNNIANEQKTTTKLSFWDKLRNTFQNSTGLSLTQFNMLELTVTAINSFLVGILFTLLLNAL
ncbi:She9 / Mdm33 family [Nakaseomyces glabratus]|nr:She9 / Mdm33 family [Nakaseomyces glabratus]KAH7579969.1 She9 / Mdm33 family [Nakaseomyces glabratus]